MNRQFLCAMAFMASILVKPALALDLAEDLTCARAIVSFETKGGLAVIANGRFAIPLRVGTPIGQASTLSCPDQGQTPRPVTVRTRDARRCVVAMQC